MTNNKKRLFDLASLYPTAKTYEQKASERKALDEKIAARQPQHIGLLAGTGLSVIFVYMLWISVFVPGIVLRDPMFGVPFMFMLGFVWMGLVYWIGKGIIDVLRLKGYNPTPFLLVYAASVTPLLTAGVFSAVGNDFMSVLVVTVIHFLVICLIVAVAYSKKLSSVTKVSILSAMWAVAFVCVVILALQHQA